MSAPIQTRTGDQILTIIKELIDERAAEYQEGEKARRFNNSFARNLDEARAEKEDLRKRFTELLASAQGERDDNMRMLAETRDAFAAYRRAEDVAKSRGGDTASIEGVIHGYCPGPVGYRMSATEVQMMRNENGELRKRVKELESENQYWKGFGNIVLRPQLNERNREVDDLRERCEFIAKRCEGIAKERDFNAAELQTARKERDDAIKNRDELKVLDGERIQTLIVERNQALAKVEQERRGRVERDVFPSNRGSASDFEWLRQSNQSLSDSNKVLQRECVRLQNEWRIVNARRERLLVRVENQAEMLESGRKQQAAAHQLARRNADRLAKWQAAYERKLKELDAARNVNADWEASFNNTVEQLKNVRRMEEDWKRMYHVVCKERGELRAVLDTLEKHKGKL